MSEVVARPRWVLDGSYSAVRHVICPRAECVIWLDLPRLLVTYRVLRRAVMRSARRKALWYGNRDRWRDMLSTDPNTSTNCRLRLEALPGTTSSYVAATSASEWKSVPIVHLRSPRQVKDYLRTLGADQDHELR